MMLCSDSDALCVPCLQENAEDLDCHRDKPVRRQTIWIAPLLSYTGQLVVVDRVKRRSFVLKLLASVEKETGSLCNLSINRQGFRAAQHLRTC